MLLTIAMKCRGNMSSAAGTGTPVSFHREARMIVGSPRNPDQSPEQLLEVVSFRRADGRVISLKKLSLAQISRALASSKSPGLTDAIDEWIEAADQQR